MEPAPASPSREMRFEVSGDIAPPRGELVRAELEKILASAGFRSSPRISRFLRYTVEHSLQGEGDQLKEYRLGVDVYDRASSYDPCSDPVVRLEARRLRAKLRDYYDDEGQEDPVRIEVPKGGYAAVFSSNVAPENLPGGVATTGEDRVRVPDTRGAPLLRLVALAILAGAVSAAAVMYLRSTFRQRPGARTAVGSSIAVLPFLNISGDPDDEHLSDGLTDELTSALAKLEGVRVIARTSAFKFKGKSEDVRSIGSQLNVTALLEGSVERGGNRLRITTQLVRVSDGSHIWSETYELDARDPFAAEDDVTRAVANALQVRLARGTEQPKAERHTADPEARDLYLRGRFWWNQRMRAEVWKSIQYFNQALKRDPLYAQAYLGLADAYFVLGMNDQAPSDVYPKARAAARQALQLDDNLSEAHGTLAAVTAFYAWDFNAAEQEFQRAIVLNPNSSTAHQRYGLLLLFSRRFEEAAREFRRAQELDPLSLIIALDMGQVYFYSENYDAAVDQARKTLAYDPNFAPSHLLLGMAYLQKGLYKEAIEEFETFSALSGRDPDALMRLGETYAVSGERDKALKFIEELKRTAKGRYSPPYDIAVVYARLGDREQAFRWLETAIQRRSSSCILLGVDFAFSGFRSDPRFRELLQKTRTPQRE